MSGCYKNLLKENEELKKRIEYLKCCGNCSWYEKSNNECYQTGIKERECLNNNHKHWELMENDL